MTLLHFGPRHEVYESRYQVDDWLIQLGTLTRTALSPGHSTRGHAHAWPELYFVEKGTGILEMRDGDSVQTVVMQLAPGVVAEIAPNRYHRVLTGEGITFWGVYPARREEAK